MEKIEYSGIDIVALFLTKLEKLNDYERRVIIKAIEIINSPMFVVKDPL